MSTGFFGDIDRIPFVGPDGDGVGPDGALGFRHYDPDELVLGKRLEDHLRFSCAYWHSFAWPGGDPFGGQTFERPWFGDTMADATLKADVRLRDVPRARRAVLLLSTTPTCAPRAGPSPRTPAV